MSVDDFTELKHWLESEREVPTGMWFKRFRKFTLAGEGEFPKTFFGAGMHPKGERSKVGMSYKLLQCDQEPKAPTEGVPKVCW